MSILFGIPVEIVSAVFGFAAAALTSVFSQPKAKQSTLLAESLAKSDEWKRFEDSRLKEILADRAVREEEWIEIFEVVEASLRNLERLDEAAEVDHDYLSRSSRAKKFIVSDLLLEKAKETAI